MKNWSCVRKKTFSGLHLLLSEIKIALYVLYFYVYFPCDVVLVRKMFADVLKLSLERAFSNVLL